MKALGLYFLLGVLFTSCAGTYSELGSLNMLSDKHIDTSIHYQKLAARAGHSRTVIKSSKANSMQEAIDQVLEKIPGSEYLTNVTIYAVKGDYIAVSGDVWGSVGGKDNNVKKGSVASVKGRK